MLDAIAAWSTLAMAVFTLALVIMAGFAWKVGRETLAASRQASEAAARSADAAAAANEQARIDSIEQTRPYVYAEIVPGLAGARCWDIRITNSGRSSARTLTLDYDQWPKSQDRIGASIRELFRTPRTLPPGCSIRAFWRVETGEPGDVSKFVGMRRYGNIDVRYTSDDPSGPVYTDRFNVMVDEAGLWPEGESGPQPSAGLTKQAKAFYSLGQTLVRRITELSR